MGIGIIKKLIFLHIFDISPCVLTQISIGRSPWMQNKILHPTSTYSIYFWQSRLPKKKKHLKTWWWCHHHIFKVFLVFWVAGSVKSMLNGYPLDSEFNLHPTISPNPNLSKNTGRYVENTNKKVVFFFSSSKINKYYFIVLTIISLILFRRPILIWNFL